MNGTQSMASRVVLVFGIVTLLALVSACRQESSAERVSRLRSGYTATLNGFIVRQEPESTGSVSAQGSDESQAAEVPVQQNVMLDILIRHDNDERLPGLTLDVSQVDSSQKEKADWRIWVDTSEIGRASGAQISYVLKNVDYQEGDGFNVEVRSPIPAGERNEYREFSSASDAQGD